MAVETQEQAPRAKKEPTCKCGHGRGHYMVSIDPEYTIGGWCLLLLGISARPTRLKYRCRNCDTVFDATTDPELLRNHY